MKSKGFTSASQNNKNKKSSSFPHPQARCTLLLGQDHPLHPDEDFTTIPQQPLKARLIFQCERDGKGRKRPPPQDAFGHKVKKAKNETQQLPLTINFVIRAIILNIFPMFSALHC